jgi:RNA polymerase sigma-70 factor, ECF subfamily
MDVSAALIHHAPELQARAFRLAKNRSAADDLWQETALRALRFAHQFTTGSNPRAWLHQILFSVFITECRRRKRQRNFIAKLEREPEADAPAASTTSDLSPNTKAKLQELPASFREVITLVDLGETSYRDAAKTLQVPVGTVMSRLHRGRKMLAEKLSPELLAA